MIVDPNLDNNGRISNSSAPEVSTSKSLGNVCPFARLQKSVFDSLKHRKKQCRFYLQIELKSLQNLIRFLLFLHFFGISSIILSEYYVVRTCRFNWWLLADPRFHIVKWRKRCIWRTPCSLPHKMFCQKGSFYDIQDLYMARMTTVLFYVYFHTSSHVPSICYRVLRFFNFLT